MPLITFFIDVGLLFAAGGNDLDFFADPEWGKLTHTFSPHYTPAENSRPISPLRISSTFFAHFQVVLVHLLCRHAEAVVFDLDDESFILHGSFLLSRKPLSHRGS